MNEPRFPLRGADRSGSAGNPPCILHVEDDAEFSAALKRRFEAHGVAVVRAFDGQDGIFQAQKYEADAVVLDVEMPHATGDQVLSVLRGHESTRSLPVIVLTGCRDRQLQQRMSDLGAAAFLTKPVQFSTLREQLAPYIDILPAPAWNPCL